MANQSGNAYALALLCPVRAGAPPAGFDGQCQESYAAHLRYVLQSVRVSGDSPMARVPNTYLSRFFLLDDVFYQGSPALEEHLKSSYLVFCCNFHGELEPYLTGMWKTIESEVRLILNHCVGFSDQTVRDAAAFIAYIKKCEIKTTFYFNGSTDQPLAEQLKGLYLKQEFSKFAFENQGRSAREIQEAFGEFIKGTEPENTARPAWKPGVYDLDKVVAK
ncbi:MAG: hypothetical protein FJW31_16145 [Acidobacteria bacterium]|nr:hypothetical protein [Acidobacteriota bacterium]